MKGVEISGEWSQNQIKTSNTCKHKNSRASSLKGYSQYNCIFQDDTKFTRSLELEQLSCTLFNCTVLHEFAVMDSLVFLCFYFVVADNSLLPMCVVVQHISGTGL